MKKAYRIKLSPLAQKRFLERSAVLYCRALERWNQRIAATK
ncbi:MAG: hypothetical protein ABR584_00275 [Candidatus Baltobacteraceae bacterium]